MRAESFGGWFSGGALEFVRGPIGDSGLSVSSGFVLDDFVGSFSAEQGGGQGGGPVVGGSVGRAQPLRAAPSGLSGDPKGVAGAAAARLGKLGPSGVELGAVEGLYG